MTPLKEITIEITRKCPHRCLHCSSNGGEPFPSELDRITLARTIAESRKLGASELLVSGGEPFESDHLLDVCRMGKSSGMDVSVFTCGSRIEEGRTRPLRKEEFEALRRAGANRVIFSVHAAESLGHDRITSRKGSFDNLIGSIEASINSGLEVEFNFVPMLVNYRSLPGVVELARNLSVRRISLLRFVPQGRGATNRILLEMSTREYREVEAFVTGLRGCPVEIRIGAHFNGLIGNSESRCTAGHGKMAVRADGRVFPCVGMKEALSKYDGNDIRNHPLEWIKNNSTVFSFAEKLPSESSESCPAQLLANSSLVVGRMPVPSPANRQDGDRTTACI